MKKLTFVLSLLMFSMLPAEQALAATALAEILKTNAEAERLDIEKVRALYGESILSDGTIEVAVKRLELFAKTGNRSPRERAHHKLTIAHLNWQYGKPESAMQFIDESLEILETTDAVLLKARLLDSEGDEEAAVAWYEKALALTGSDEEREFIRIRLTMVDVDGRNVDALVDLAGQRDQAFKNRSAVALAVLGHANDAVGLYRPDPEAEKAFQQHVRQAEWAIVSEKLELAQQMAWAAYESTDSRVDSLYALTLVVEAYRKDGALNRLIDRIDRAGELNEDLLKLRVELLIETEQYDAAIDYYKGLSNADADAQARLRLIQLYETAGRTDEMIAEYQRLMQAEPGIVLWYTGLAAYYANAAQPENALRAWQTLEKNNASHIGVLVSGAEEMLSMGFVDEATAMIDRYMTVNGENARALMFLFETHFRRGEDADALAAIERLAASLPPGSGDFRVVADAYERLNKHDQALRVFEELRETEGGLGYDERTRLAWLYAVVGEKQKSLDAWREIWVSVESPARRSFAEAQFLLLAAELNVLADIVVDIEDKLFQQKADLNEINLLVRIYTEVNDAFSAGEVIDEYAKYSGGSEVLKLRQLAKVYLQLSEYAKYDEVMRKLEQIDPENRVEHIQNLVLNMLSFDLAEGSDERYEEIEHWLDELRDYDSEAVSGEFEAGILAMGGFNQEAIESYRRALVERPSHSDNLLLMADLMKTTGRTDEAVSLLQYVAEHATGDNEFVVAIDGIINMIGQRRRGQELAPELQATFRWTQRIILERITGRDDKFYLYTLLSEIAQEVGDKDAEFAAVENSLSQAGIRRASVLRELVTMSTPGAGFGFATGNLGDVDRQITYGRRLIGLRQQLPPEVYISLGKSLLDQGDTQGAEKAFNMINDVTGLIDVNQTKADIFKVAGYADQALAYYNQALSVNRDDLQLLLETAVLREGTGQDDVANTWYLRALTNLLKSQSAVLRNEAPKTDDPMAMLRQPVDTSVNHDYRRYYEVLMQGFLLTWPSERTLVADRIDAITGMFDAELGNAVAEFGDEGALPLAKYSRLNHMAKFMRRVAHNTGSPQLALHADRRLIEHFADDEDYAEAITAEYRESGQFEFAGSLAKKAGVESNEPLRGPLLEAALEEAKENGDIEAAVKLARLAGNEDELERMFRKRIQAGKYREGLAYARAMLTEAEFGRFLSSMAVTLRENESAFSELLFSDPALVADIEQRSGQELITVIEVAEALTQLDGRASMRLAFGGSGSGIWGYVTSKASTDELVEFVRYLADNMPKPQFGWPDESAKIRHLLQLPLSHEQRKAVYETAAKFISRVDAKNEYAQNTLVQYVLMLDAHPDNEDVLYDLADYCQQRVPGWRDLKPVIRAVFDGKDDEAFDELLALGDALGPRGSWTIRRHITSTRFEASFERAIERLENGLIDDPQTARSLYEYKVESGVLFGQGSASDLRDAVSLLDAMVEQFPKDVRYLRERASLYQLLGDRVRTEQAFADLYDFDPADEFARAAYYFHLLDDQKFERANAIAADGGPDLRVEAVVEELLKRLEADRFPGPGSSARILQQTRGQVNTVSMLSYFGDDFKRNVERLRAMFSTDGTEDAARTLRSVWRNTASLVSKNSRMASIFHPAMLLATLPVDDQARVDLDPFTRRAIGVADRVRSVTALVEYGDAADEKMLLEAVAELPGATAELEGLLAAMPAERRRNLTDMYRLVADGYQLSRDGDARLDALSSLLNAGTIGDHELTLWMLLRDRHSDAVTEKEANELEKRLLRSPQMTDLQLLSAARIFAGAGLADKAVDYYKLFAVRQVRFGEFASDQRAMVFGRSNSAFILDLSELVSEIADRLPSDLADEATKDIVAVSPRADDEPEYRAYHDAFVLRALGKVLEPTEALAAAAAISPSAVTVSETPEPYEVFKLIELAHLRALSGDREAANAALLALLAKPAEKPAVAEDDREAQARRANLARSLSSLANVYGFPRSPDAFGNEPSPTIASVIKMRERLFPSDAASRTVNLTVANTLMQSLEDEALDRDAVLSAVLTIAYQLRRGGEGDEANRVVEDVAGWIAGHPGRIGAVSMKNLSAMALHLGTVLPLHLSREILLGGGLSVEEESSLLTAVADKYGADQALAVGRELEAGELILMQQLLPIAEDLDSGYASELERRIGAAEAAKALAEADALQAAN